jgi:RNA binding exosome subunit
VQKRYHFLKVSTFVNATEDMGKVKQALRNLLDHDIEEHLEVTELEGVHHNPIQYLTIEFKRARDIRRVLGTWESMDFWKNALLQVEDRLDEDLTFHVRVNKMEAFGGNILLWKEGEAIEIRLKPASFPASRDVAKQIIIDGPLIQ